MAWVDETFVETDDGWLATDASNPAIVEFEEKADVARILGGGTEDGDVEIVETA